MRTFETFVCCRKKDPFCDSSAEDLTAVLVVSQFEN